MVRRGNGAGQGPAQGPGNGNPPAPPFEPGNQAAVTHGANSEGIIDALAAEFAQRAIDTAPYLGIERFRWALIDWSRAQARLELIHRHLDAHGLINNRGTPRMNLLAMLAASERAANRGRAALGLDPESSAKIAALIRVSGADLLSPGERTRMAPMLRGRR